MRTWIFLAGLAAVLVVATSCGRKADSGPSAGGRLRVALVMKTLNSPFFLDMQRGAEEAARALGVDLVVQAPDRELDVEKQVQTVENLIQAKVNVLCLTPSGSKELVPVVGKANRAGIPVVVVDTRLDEGAVRAEGVTYASFIGSDNREGGRIAGEHLGRLASGPLQVVLLEGIPGHETADSRIRGFREGIAAFPQVQVVASQPANAERDQGFNVMQNLLQAHHDIQAVFAVNDLMALGALEAIAAAGRTGTIRVFGFDAVDEARQEIAAGRMEASVAQNPAGMGRLAVETAVRLARGESVPREQPVAIDLITREKLGGGTR